MFDEANSLCTTSNLPLSVRAATKGLLSATVPLAEAMLGCIYERAKDRDIKKVFQAVLFLPSHSSVPSYNTTRELTRQWQKGKIPITISLDKYDVLIQNSTAPFKEKHFSYLILSSSPNSLLQITLNSLTLSLPLRI